MSPLIDRRADFDLGDRIYLDGAAHGPMPRRALEAARSAIDTKRDPASLRDADYFDLPDRIRAAAASLINCAPEQIAIATGASHAISLVACGLDWEGGEHVVVPTGEFPANNLPWRDLAMRGVEVEFVDPDRLEDAIRDSTRVVAVGHVNFATGLQLDLASLGERCAEVGALFLVDASQSVGATSLDVQACQASVVGVAGYKWIMSPYGTGFTYVHPDWVERFRLPTFNWATIVGADDFNKLVDLDPVQRPGAIRFDVPETAAFIHGAAMAESLEYLQEVGVEAVHAHATGLIDLLVERLSSDTVVVSDLAPDRRSSIVRLQPAGDAKAVYERLFAAGIKVSLREGGIRVAPGVWNASPDIERLATALNQ